MAKAESKASKKAAVAAGDMVAALQYEADVVRAHVDTIDRNPTWNVTRQDEQGLGDLSGLMRELERDGQRVPVEVTRAGERFRLAAGFRRCEAIAKLHKAGKHDGMVTMRVLTADDALTLTLANVKENEDTGRLQVTWLGRSVGYQALAAQGLSRKAIADLVGRAEDVVRDALRFGDCDPRCQAATVADSLGKPVPVSAPVYKHDKDSGKFAPVLDQAGNQKHKDVDQEGVVWGVVRLVLRKPKAEQGYWLDKVGHLSVAGAMAVLNGHDKADKADKADKEPKDGEGEEPSEGEGPGNEDGIEKFRAEVAQRLCAALQAGQTAQAQVTAALRNGDTSAAMSANMAVAEVLRTLAQAVVTLAGQGNVEAATRAAEKASRRGK